jgi:cellulose synthase/poly-beta-1,6-N-acetylglucosamine synthase-like glycosyltransferase
MFKESVKRENVRYVLLFLPFIFAYISWRWFPLFAEQVVFHVFRYAPSFRPAHWLWYLSVFVLYSWYTFLVIGIGGFFVVAAWIYKKEENLKRTRDYPMVSFVVPAYNEERLIARCIESLFKSASRYPGPSEIVVVDDGSVDQTYEVAWTTIRAAKKRHPYILGKVVRHSTNLGRAEAVRTGVNKAMGEVLCVVDADSWWEPNTLCELVNHLNESDVAALTGYIHPTDGKTERNLLIIFQQQEYSQALGVFRCAQALASTVFIVPGPIGLHRAYVFRNVLNERKARSVTEDFETTLEMRKRKLKIGYSNRARSITIAPDSLTDFWKQRLRWFTGGLHNILELHRDLLFKRLWVSALLWYSLIVEYGGALLEIAALAGLPFFFWFAPDRTFFLYNLFLFLLFVLLVGLILQAIALKFAYNQYNHRRLLLYVPLYLVLRFLNVGARLVCLAKYTLGERGSWHKAKRPILS